MKTRILVNGRWTYETDLPVQVGDSVILPGPQGGEWQGKVTALSSPYHGPCREVIRIGTKEAKE